MEGTRWLPYDELAKALGITPDSARRLVTRKKWPRQQGNDGRALVAVPVERLPPDSPPDAGPDSGEDAGPGIGPDALPDVRPVITPDELSPVQVLQARIGELETELRVEREKSAGLAAVVDVERRHAGEVKADRDAWRAQAERLAARSWWPWRRSA